MFWLFFLSSTFHHSHYHCHFDYDHYHHNCHHYRHSCNFLSHFILIYPSSPSSLLSFHVFQKQQGGLSGTLSRIHPQRVFLVCTHLFHPTGEFGWWSMIMWMMIMMPLMRTQGGSDDNDNDNWWYRVNMMIMMPMMMTQGDGNDNDDH